MAGNYVKFFLQMCRSKVARPPDTRHVSWAELFAYAFRQSVHLARKTYDRGVTTYKVLDDKTCSIQIPLGEVFLPASLKPRTISRLLREAFDKKHWHQYDTVYTPVTPEDVIVDCGASEGIWALSVVSKVKKIYLIEPQPEFIETLKRNFRPWIEEGRAEIIEGATGSVDGTCSLSLSEQDADIGQSVQYDAQGKTRVHKLDTLFRDKKITYLKADVEGFEMELLKGAADIVKRDKPKIAITVYHFQNDWQEMKNFLLSLVPEYRWKLRGLVFYGKPMMLHLWTD